MLTLRLRKAGAVCSPRQVRQLYRFSDNLYAYQCYAPLPPVWAIVGQGGDLINLHINCLNIRDIPNNQIPLQKVGDYWGFDTRSVTVQ